MTATMRFGGTINQNLKDMSVRLVPYPRIHFLIPSISNSMIKGEENQDIKTVPELAESLFDSANMLKSTYNTKAHYNYIATDLVFQGAVSISELINIPTIIRA